ncbi:hypothetical protein ACIQUM_14970 [Amycolatopsis azurea]|uniref:hypothetical protein n=1 Tax=Amycolatopsis azurea TaxID=36819 RepID=UPI003801B16A
MVADDGNVFGNVWFGPGGPSSMPVMWQPGGGITVLPTVPGATTTVGGLDRRGVVIGEAVDGEGVSRAVVWDRGRAIVLPSLGGSRSWISAGDSEGVHVGVSATPDGKNHAVRWDRTGRITRLDELSRSIASSAADLDDTGLITGAVEFSPGESRAVIWDRYGHVVTLPDLGGRFNEASTISRSGKILGIADHPDQASCDCHNTVYWNRSGRLTDLGLPFGAISTRPDGGINRSGMIAGTAHFSPQDQVSHVIRWDRDDRPADLGTLGGTWSIARGINDRGAVIGDADTGALYASHAVYWDPSGRAYDLGALPGSNWSSVSDLNDHDVVVGFSQDPQTWSGRAVKWRRW